MTNPSNPKISKPTSIPVPDGRDRRRFVRLSIALPIEMLIHEGGSQTPTSVMQGYTRDVSAGGVCLEYRAINPKEVFVERYKNALIDLYINVPFRRKPITAQSRIAWYRPAADHGPSRHIVGLEFQRIDKKDAASLLGYARMRQRAPFLMASLFTALLVAGGAMYQHQFALKAQNRAFVRGVVEGAQGRQEGLKRLDDLGQQEKSLRQKIGEYDRLLKGVQSKEAATHEESERQTAELTRLLAQVKDIKEQMRRIGELRIDEEAKTDLSALTDSAPRQKIVAELHSWLLKHTDARTGLVSSYEGDPKLEDMSFTYDQALVVIVNSLLGRWENAKKILSFYLREAPKSDGAFVSSYHTRSGQAMEWNVHVGPNVWLGLAALQYQKLSGDRSYEPLAVDLGNWLIALQREDSEGGLRGGPKFTWYSTEHNLDAYAFFQMLYEIKKEERYKEAGEKLFAWIFRHAVDKAQGRLNRGKGDATIATDTFSWAIATIGPARLAQTELDPEGIMDFAEENCRVTVRYDRPDGKSVEITGFDFAKPQHQPRGGLVSSEWTSQAIVTFRVLASYFDSRRQSDKAQHYTRKVNFYLNELQKMIISSLSKTGQGKGCLPYATLPDAPTGHGWRTPNGHKTGSVAGTAYGIFAWLGFNPFQLDQDRFFVPASGESA